MEIVTIDNKNYAKSDYGYAEISQDFVLTERVISYATPSDLLDNNVTLTLDVLAKQDWLEDGYLLSSSASFIAWADFSDSNNLHVLLGTSDIDTGIDLFDDSWHRISITYDDSTNYIIEVDGVKTNFGIYTGTLLLGDNIYIGAKSDATLFGNLLVCNFRIEHQTRTEEQLISYHELLEPFWDADPNSIPPVVSFSNTDNIYAVDTKRTLTTVGRVNIRDTDVKIIKNDGIDDFTKIFNAGEEIEIDDTSSGTVRYTIDTVDSAIQLTVTADITEDEVVGLVYRNYTWKDIIDSINSLKEFKKVKSYS